MWFWAGNKNNQALLEYGGRGTFDMGAYAQALATNYGLTTDDISIYTLEDNASEVGRLKNGDSFSLIWSGAVPSGVISGISFALEDSKKWLHFTSNKTSIIGNGKDTLILYASIYQTNNTDLDASATPVITIPINFPSGVSTIRMGFVGGKASRLIKVTSPGNIIFPAVRRLDNYRINNIINITTEF